MIRRVGAIGACVFIVGCSSLRTVGTVEESCSPPERPAVVRRAPASAGVLIVRGAEQSDSAPMRVRLTSADTALMFEVSGNAAQIPTHGLAPGRYKLEVRRIGFRARELELTLDPVEAVAVDLILVVDCHRWVTRPGSRHNQTLGG